MPTVEESQDALVKIFNGTTTGTPILAIRDHLAAIRAALEAHSTIGGQIKTAIEGISPSIAQATINQTQARQPLTGEGAIKAETTARTGAARSPGIPR